jgi:hypothetical protein
MRERGFRVVEVAGRCHNERGLRGVDRAGSAVGADYCRG